MKSYDVIIIGCGPAGVASAQVLKDNNISFCMIDKEKFPRKKLCAGGLTNKCVNLLNDLGFTLENIPYQEIRTLSVQSKSKIYNLNLQNPAISIDRTEFDNNNLNVIKKYSKDIFENEKIIEITKNTVISESHKFKYKYIIFADGVNGISRKYNNKILGFCVECDVNQEALKNEVLLSFDIVKYGYGWIFPKTGFSNIGFGKFRCIKDNYKDKLIKFGNDKKFNMTSTKITGFHIPLFRNKHNIVIDNNKLLTGDAIGLVDPLTGEGIYYALLSGKLAAQSIVEQRNGKNSNLKHIYKRNINSVFMNLSIRKILNIIFYSSLQNIFIKILFSNKFTKKFLEKMFN